MNILDHEVIPLSEVHKVIERHVRDNGLTYPEVARMGGCSDRHLRRVRRGDHPACALQIVRRLGYRVDVRCIVEPR